LRETFPELAAFAEKRAEKRKVGRPKVSAPKRSKSFKLSPSLIDAIVASGKGYNARVEQVLFRAIEEGLV
jgi:uncharacterized protein (DUF4415 family)